MWVWKSEEHHLYEKDYIWNTATCSCYKSKYAESINADSVITCDEIAEKTKQFQETLMKKS